MASRNQSVAIARLRVPTGPEDQSQFGEGHVQSRWHRAPEQEGPVSYHGNDTKDKAAASSGNPK